METKKKILITVCIILAFILCLIGCLFFLKNCGPQQVQAGGANVKVDTRASDTYTPDANPLSGRMITYVGFDNSILEQGDQLLLENPPENQDFYLKYTIKNTETGDTVFETDLIPAGNSIAWIPSDNLEVGEHNLSFVQAPYYKDETTGEFTPLAVGNNNVVITIQ